MALYIMFPRHSPYGDRHTHMSQFNKVPLATSKILKFCILGGELPSMYSMLSYNSQNVKQIRTISPGKKLTEQRSKGAS